MHWVVQRKHQDEIICIFPAIMKRFFKKSVIAATICCGLLLILFLFHVPLLRIIGNQLIDEDRIEKTSAVFVLSGDAWDRGNEAIKLYKQGFVKKIICTGENIPRLFLIAGIPYPESELTQLHLIANGIPARDIELLCKGTSTKEEADYILEYCKQRDINKLTIISTKFHTRRIGNTFRKKFEAAGLQLIIRGAPSSAYDENKWWESEDGLIFVNNEYIKILYYRMKGY